MAKTTAIGLIREAQAALYDAMWLAERQELHALEGEIQVVLASLDNILGAIRREGPGIRRFGEMKLG